MNHLYKNTLKSKCIGRRSPLIDHFKLNPLFSLMALLRFCANEYSSSLKFFKGIFTYFQMNDSN